MRILAGIDAGGTRTRLALVRMNGTVLAYAEGGCCSFAELGVVAASAALQSLWNNAWSNAGTQPRPADAVFIGSGSILSETDATTCTSIIVDAGIGRFGAVQARNDACSALAAGLLGQPGILLIAGTGTACVGRNASGETWRASGWGHLLDDGGSAYALGQAAMIAATRHADARGPATTLTPAVLRVLNLQDITGIYRRVHHDGVSRALVASLAPLVVEAAQAGDVVAQRLLQQGAQDLVTAVLTVARKLKLNAPLLALTGGLIKNAQPYRQIFLERLAQVLPGFSLATGGVAPVWGSILLAWEQLEGKPPPAEFLRQLAQHNLAAK